MKKSINEMNKSTCDCGQEFNFVITIFMTNNRIICPKCKKMWYMEYASIDWEKVNKGK